MGSKGYQEGRSYLYGDLSTAQDIVNTYHGTGEIILTRSGEWSNKEVITAAEDLGVEVNPTTGSETATNRATIHYGKNGTHIVPARREKET